MGPIGVSCAAVQFCSSTLTKPAPIAPMSMRLCYPLIIVASENCTLFSYFLILFAINARQVSVATYSEPQCDKTKR